MAVLAGCAYVPAGMVSEHLSQDALPDSSRFSQYGVLVAPVTGVENNLWQVINGDVMVRASVFREALIRSLRQVKLFAEVVTEGNARYVLQAEIKTQQKTTFGAVLVVHYVLSDANSGLVVWSEDIQSSSFTHPGIGTFLTPEASISQAAFRAAGNNIETMLMKVAWGRLEMNNLP